MADQDLRRALDHAKMGAAAVGICIARILAESDHTILRKIVAEAEKMQTLLSQGERADGAEILAQFALGLAHPERFPLFTPGN